MKYKIFAQTLALLVISVCSVYGQSKNELFTIEKELRHLPVINQGSTGTCWSFATTSFLESEIIRKGMDETDLSEMYFVYFSYMNKAKKYLYYQGNNNFGQGGQAHDVFDVLREKGAVPYEDYPGLMEDGSYRHGPLVKELKDEVIALNNKSENFSSSGLKSCSKILNKQMGKLPKKVKTGKGNFSPAEIAEKSGINPDDYIELSSYAHHPFYKPFVLEVPDNWAHGLYYNVPIDELMEIMFFAISNGYTVCWDGDTSEKTFSHKNGKADLPEKQRGKVDDKLRLETFLNRETTDDHLMHVVGLSKDSDGRTCFYTKNSWGAESNSFGGYLHMTEDYVKLKTVAILVHKDAIPEKIRKKLICDARI